MPQHWSCVASRSSRGESPWPSPASPAPSKACRASCCASKAPRSRSAAVYTYHRVGGSWWLFACLILVPDVSLLGYLGGTRLGAIAYNAFHVTLGPLVCGGARLPAAVVRSHPDCADLGRACRHRSRVRPRAEIQCGLRLHASRPHRRRDDRLVIRVSACSVRRAWAQCRASILLSLRRSRLHHAPQGGPHAFHPPSPACRGRRAARRPLRLRADRLAEPVGAADLVLAARRRLRHPDAHARRRRCRSRPASPSWSRTRPARPA